MIKNQEVKKTPIKWYLLGPLIAMLGGLFGIMAAGYENSWYGWFAAVFVAAPVFEEAMKPCGVYWLLGRRPFALPNQIYTVFLSALAGLTFGIIESSMYVWVFFPEYAADNPDFVIWRFTVCLALHSVCSGIMGLGINEKLVQWVRGEVRFMGGNWKFYLAAVLIHSAYNITMTFIELFPEPEDALRLFGFIW